MSGCKNRGLHLKSYQEAVATWFKTHPSQKGMIIQFATGTGKTLLAANLSEMMRREGTVKRVLVVTPKSLKNNFADALMMCTGKNRISSKYTIESFTKLVNDVMGESTRRNGKRLARLRESLLIVDEAHNLRNPKALRTKVIGLLAQSAKHVLLLTATPFVNGVKDIVPLTRMIVSSREVDRWPLTRAEFDLRTYQREMKHKVAFFEGAVHLKPRVVIRENLVPLTEGQAKDIDKLRLSLAKQIQILRRYMRGEELNEKELQKIQGLILIMRQMSNVLKDGGCAPKVEALVNTVVAGPKPAIIYSEFIGKGVDVVKRCLEKKGVEPAKIAVFTGDLSTTARSAIVSAYNRREVDYLLITAAGGEGISLKGTRQVHLLEPFWNMARMWQSIGRGVRIDSHGHLPEGERQVDVFFWLSSKPRRGRYADWIAPDQHVLNVAKRKKGATDPFVEANKRASIPLDPAVIRAMVPPPLPPSLPLPPPPRAPDRPPPSSLTVPIPRKKRVRTK